MKAGMAKKPPETDLWTSKEAADYLRISLKTIWVMVSVPPEEGGPPVIRVATRKNKKTESARKFLLRFPREQFINWCKNGGTQCSA